MSPETATSPETAMSPKTIQADQGQVRDDLLLLNQVQAAEYLTIHPRTMENWRGRGEGPRFIRVGRRIRYRLRDLRAWLDENTFSSTTEADQAG